ncbi:immediate early response gene 2 protein-like [Xiphophorus maculatus]|uniref:Immediate early response gene 2 protein-like n=2 Tax=Xiphophorus TaxID=8082 RepID=M4AHP8_XIPMA|nr:immediate early response gene 2 protein-like [Xiphophorus maculatus]XP_027899006.1 immediate early response gene 2 protein-like [Xiphophorus couchianus]
MEVSAEAKRIMVVALGKLYSSRTQRGGLRLHRSLLLTLVMKSARDIYHAAQTTAESMEEEQPSEVKMTTEASGTQELQGPASLPHLAADADAQGDAQNQDSSCLSGPPHHTRKRRGKATAEPDFLPCKKAKLEYGTAQQLIVSSVLVDYANCCSELGPSPSPIPLQTVIAAC